jgi:L-aspartate semialdehyde sulfurtransferase ferredoxin
VTEAIETVRVQLDYPPDRVREPLLYRLVTDFGLVPNIRRANFDVEQGGFIFLELEGPSEALARGLAWMQESGISVSAIGFDGTQEWAI